MKGLLASGRTGHGDVEEMARCMSLTLEESAFIDWLPVGQAIVAMKGRVRRPLHVAFPRVPVDKGASPLD